MLLDYHSFYEEPAPAPAPAVVWMPPQRAKKRARQVIHATVDMELPALVGEGSATVRATAKLDAVLPLIALAIAASGGTTPPTPITDIDLDAQEDGWTDDKVLLAVAAWLLLEEEDDKY